MTKSIEFVVPDPILLSLGSVIIGWARIDAMIAEMLSFLLQADRRAMYILNQDVAASTQMKWIRTLTEDKFTDPNTLDGLKTLYDRIDLARVERNTYAHGLWAPGPVESTAAVQTVKLSRVEVIKSELVTVADLDELHSDIMAIGDEFHSVLVALGAI